MTGDEILDVWTGQRLVGHLRRGQSAGIGFQYDSEWLGLSGAYPVSQTLPLSNRSFSGEDGVAHRFFANLLPEGDVRERTVRDLQIPNTDFDLLKAIGGECAGALSILPSDRKPSQEFTYRLIGDDELARLAAHGGWTRSSGSAYGHPRLSLAGAQDKCPVLVRDGGLYMPQHEAPSSHILKFELATYRNVPAYETYTMRLARAVEIPVAKIDLCSIGKTYYSLIGRYDRQRDDEGGISRFHQEDFCQALGFGRERKYQSDGGPSFAQCLHLIRRISDSPVRDTLHLLRWQIFNVLAGNSDAHAKNMSILYLPDGGVRLAPFYDLVCTRAIKNLDVELAFAVGGESDPNRIQRKHWHILATECDVRAQFIFNLVMDIATQIIENIDRVRQEIENQSGSYPALQNVRIAITKQCRRIVRGLERSAS